MLGFGTAGSLLAAGLIVWSVFTYNLLIKYKNLMKEAWSGIDVQLKRRYDLIPNLVETVKGYAKHEKDQIGRASCRERVCLYV